MTTLPHHAADSRASASPLARLMRLWHTVRWLRPVQVWGRAWFRFHRPKPDLSAAPPLRPAAGYWLACARPASMTGPTSFRFLDDERDIACADGNWAWDDLSWRRLWRYNLHYFDDLLAADAGARETWHRSLIDRWMADNPPGQGTGWEPYPASLRIVNWVKWARGEGGAAQAGVDAAGGVRSSSRLSAVAMHSLAVQARWLRGRLEIHLLGNHLWANAKALVFAGAFFDGPEAARWLDKGLELMRREVREQILPDGGHFERSPMYHATLLEDLLDLLQLGERYPGVLPASLLAEWREVAGRMLDWLRAMTHPDGGIAFFNDAAFGIAPPLGVLEPWAQRLLGAREGGREGEREHTTGPVVLQALPDSGYLRLETGPAVLIVDVGPVGPDYLPGHAHADTLSFELSLHGRRMIVNSGTSTYQADVERLRQRGTAAHSTVVVDGADSSEVWSSFRVARRARPFDLQWREGDGHSLVVRAAHDGYRRLPGRVVHRREWQLFADRLVVIDRLEGEYRHAQARFHLHPEADPAALGAPDSLRIEASTWHPRFGASEPNRVLVADFSGRSELVTEFRWPASH